MDAKSFAQQKRKRRQWLTFVRMCRYGVNNFSRNTWLTIAATAVMTITLLIVFTTLIARNILVDTVDDISSKVDMSIYLKTDTPDDVGNAIKSDLEKLSNVERVTFINAADVRADSAVQNQDESDVLEAIKEAANKNFAIIRVNLDNINDTSQLEEFVKSNEQVKEYLDPRREPSFAGERRDAIKSITQWVSVAERGGLIATIIFVTISSLIVFNTIRMAIFNRKEEIQMMKLIGADRSFIRGPFVVEAVVYGFIAAVVATILGLIGLYAIKDRLMSYQIPVQGTIDTVTLYIGFVLLGMIFLGALIGVVSSLLATRRYLKI